MPKMKGPAILLAQFMRDEEPYNSIENIGRWVAGLGYVGVQIPTWDLRIIDLNRAAESKMYCDDYKGKLKEIGLEPTELGGYHAGQVLAVHPTYEVMFEVFHPPGLKGDARTEWASGELKKCVHASVNMGTDVIPALSGGFAWHMVYPWPQRPDGIIEEAFKELAKRWRPLLDLAYDNGTVFAYELHPGSDIYDGATYEMFLDFTDDHPAACLNYDPKPSSIATARLSGIHQALWRAGEGISRQRRRVPTNRTSGRLWGISIVGRTRRSVPFAGRRSSRFQACVYAFIRGWLRWLGYA